MIIPWRWARPFTAMPDWPSPVKAWQTTVRGVAGWFRRFAEPPALRGAVHSRLCAAAATAATNRLLEGPFRWMEE